MAAGPQPRRACPPGLLESPNRPETTNGEPDRVCRKADCPLHRPSLTEPLRGSRPLPSNNCGRRPEQWRRMGGLIRSLDHGGNRCWGGARGIGWACMPRFPPGTPSNSCWVGPWARQSLCNPPFCPWCRDWVRWFQKVASSSPSATAVGAQNASRLNLHIDHAF